MKKNLHELIGACLMFGLVIFVAPARQQTFNSPGPVFPDCQTGVLQYNATTKVLSCGAGGGGGGTLPSGFIGLVVSGTCPAGTSEVAALDGKTLFGTLAANADVGDTGGNDSITPAGTNSAPTFTGTPFSGVINHTHTVNVTDNGHQHTTLQVQGGTTASTTGTHIMTSTATGGSSRAATNPEKANTATTGITATTSNPAGGVASITPAGSVSAPTFTGTQFDNRSAFTKVIFCSAN